MRARSITPIEKKMELSKAHLLGIVGFTSILFTGTLMSFTPLLQQLCLLLYSQALLLAAGAFACACASSLAYLFQEVQLKQKRFLLAFYHLPALERLDTLCYQSVVVGVSLSVLGLLTAFLLQNNYHSDWLQQILAARCVWLVYLLQLFVRFILCRRGRKSAYVSILCFSILLFLYASFQW